MTFVIVHIENYLMGSHMKKKDIICNKWIKSPSKYFSEIEQTKYEFCSAYCKLQFDQNPTYYINKYLERNRKISFAQDYVHVYINFI